MMADVSTVLPQHWFTGVLRQFARKSIAEKHEFLRDMPRDVLRTLDTDALCYHTEIDLLDAQFFTIYEQVVTESRTARQSYKLYKDMLHIESKNVRGKPWRKRTSNMQGGFVEWALLGYLADIKSTIDTDVAALNV
jgi:hypothetical protein